MVVVTVAGPPGSGKTTLAKKLARKLGLEYYSVGTFFRNKAKEAGMDFVEYLKQVPKEVHLEADRHCGEYAKKGNMVVDARLGAYMVHNADFKIFITAPLGVRAERTAKREGLDVGEAESHISERYETMIEDYKEIYDIDVTDTRIYDLVLNTEFFGINDVVWIVENIVRKGLKI